MKMYCVYYNVISLEFAVLAATTTIIMYVYVFRFFKTLILILILTKQTI